MLKMLFAVVGNPGGIVVLMRELEYAADEARDAEQNEVGKTFVRTIPNHVTVGAHQVHDHLREKASFFHHLTLLCVGKVLSFVEFAACAFPHAGVVIVSSRSFDEQQTTVVPFEKAATHENDPRSFRSHCLSVLSKRGILIGTKSRTALDLLIYISRQIRSVKSFLHAIKRFQ
jgi:hypothetical protein